MTITRGCILAAIAIVLALLQHALYVLSFLSAFDRWMPVWLAINGIEIVLMLAVGARLWATRRVIAVVISAIGLALLGAVVVENAIVETLGDAFWLPMSITILFGLILIAMFAPSE